MPKSKLKTISSILFFLGLAIIFFSLYPIFEYEYVSRKRFPSVVSPISQKERYQILNSLTDYKIISNWSSEYKTITHENNGISYSISIPKLRIKDAQVRLGGEDLSDNLIQYPGTAIPGQIGNTVIFGHSVLPVFFDPKNYLTIFSTLPRLDIDDEIFVNIDGILYKYQISEMFEVEPDNLDILDQRTGESSISIVTCVPPGHPLKPRRLVVKAVLVKL